MGNRYQAVMGDLAVLSHEKGGYDPKWYKRTDGFRPEDPTVWEMLDELRLTRFRRADGREMPVFCTVIDSGGSFTDVVYQYTKLHEFEKVYAVKGGSQPRRPLLSKHVRAGAARAALFVLGVDVGKEQVYSRLRLESPGPGYCHFPDNESAGYGPHYYAGLISEKRIIKVVNGRKVVKWILPDGARNEPFDLRVYNTAAIRIHRANWDRLKADLEKGGAVHMRNRQLPSAPAYGGMEIQL